MRKAYTTIMSAVVGVGVALALSSGTQAQTRTLNMQSSWPASLTLQENFTYFAERVEKLSRRLAEDQRDAGRPGRAGVRSARRRP